ncbi:MAG: hypothetical protein HYU78_13355 [Rhodocyclales bacterium]|nr:hypothetical protein [Rhodocyclales bacterium]
MLRRTAFNFLNHLLAAEGWALSRLKPFAGQHARFEFGPFGQSFAVAGDGSLAAGDDGHAAAVTIRLPDDAPLRFLTDRASLLASARISGSADFAEALGFVARNLRWDIEADLAAVVGDVPARRLAGAGRHLLSAGEAQARRLGANLGEYVVDEAGWVVRSAEAAAVAREIAALSEALGRLEVRVTKLAKT